MCSVAGKYITGPVVVAIKVKTNARCSSKGMTFAVSVVIISMVTEAIKLFQSARELCSSFGRN